MVGRAHLRLGPMRKPVRTLLSNSPAWFGAEKMARPRVVSPRLTSPHLAVASSQVKVAVYSIYSGLFWSVAWPAMAMQSARPSGGREDPLLALKAHGLPVRCQHTHIRSTENTCILGI